jgi:preprotein translocase subunit YajC
MFFTPAYAQATGAAQGAEGLFQFLLPIVLIFIVFYFLLIRPQQKKAKEHRDMVEAVKRGDQVVTAGGIIGKVTKVGEEGRVTVEIAPTVKVEILRATITDVLSKPVPTDGDKGKRKDKRDVAAAKTAEVTADKPADEAATGEGR